MGAFGFGGDSSSSATTLNASGGSQIVTKDGIITNPDSFVIGKGGTYASPGSVVLGKGASYSLTVPVAAPDLSGILSTMEQRNNPGAVVTQPATVGPVTGDPAAAIIAKTPAGAAAPSSIAQKVYLWIGIAAAAVTIWFFVWRKRKG